MSTKLDGPPLAEAADAEQAPAADFSGAEQKSNVKEWRYVDGQHAEVGPVCFGELKVSLFHFAPLHFTRILLTL